MDGRQAPGPSCLYFSLAEVTGMFHHVWLTQGLEICIRISVLVGQALYLPSTMLTFPSCL